MFIPLGDEVRKQRLPWVTFALVLVHIGLFVGTAEFGESLDDGRLIRLCFDWGVSGNTLTQANWHHLFSYWLLDKSVFSMVSTVAILAVLGPTLENRAGKLLFLLLYLLPPVVAGAAYALFPGNHMPTIGSSGAAAGVIGLYSIYVGISTNLRTIFLWGYQTVPVSVLAGTWFVIQALLCAQIMANSPVVSMGLVIPAFVASIVFAVVTSRFTPSVIVIQNTELTVVERSYRGTEVADEVFSRRTEEEEVATETNTEDCTYCPCCHTNLADCILQNKDADFYYCTNDQCNRLIFKTNLAAPPTAVAVHA